MRNLQQMVHVRYAFGAFPALLGVSFGGEHSRDEMREYSVVLSRYGITGEVVGVLGVIGPTRMAYPRTISTVRYISTVMSDLLGDLYGGEGNRS